MENTRSSKRCRFVKGDWADLPTDILVLIAERLVYLKDFLFFCSVCKQWQTVAPVVPKIPPRSPLVMLPEDAKTKETQTRRFYCLATSKVYEFGLPEASGRKCFGAGYGWLWTIGYDLQISLLHPFSRRQIKLPHLLAFKDQYEYDEDYKPERLVSFFVSKVVLSKNPQDNVNRSSDNNDFTAVAIYGEFRVLAFARARDEVWTNIAVSSKVHEDVIYYKDMFYAVDCHGVLFLCDIDNENGPLAIALTPSPVGYDSADQKYLVESSGTLLLLSRARDDILWEGYNTGLFHTLNFSIYRLDQDMSSEYPYKWTQIKNLDGRALFLGNNVSTSLPPSDGVKANCIYFTEDDHTWYFSKPGGGGHDTGIFYVGRNTIEKHYASNFSCPLSPPIWYI